jgi:hypothetical protein
VFSPAVRTGNLVFLSGQIGVRPGTPELVPGGIGPETEQTLTNIRTLLEGIGLSMADVVKCTGVAQHVVVKGSDGMGCGELKDIVSRSPELSHDGLLDVLIRQELQAVRAASRISSSVPTACRA